MTSFDALEIIVILIVLLMSFALIVIDLITALFVLKTLILVLIDPVVFDLIILLLGVKMILIIKNFGTISLEIFSLSNLIFKALALANNVTDSLLILTDLNPLPEISRSVLRTVSSTVMTLKVLSYDVLD